MFSTDENKVGVEWSLLALSMDATPGFGDDVSCSVSSLCLVLQGPAEMQSPCSLPGRGPLLPSTAVPLRLVGLPERAECVLFVAALPVLCTQ